MCNCCPSRVSQTFLALLVLVSIPSSRSLGQDNAAPELEKRVKLLEQENERLRETTEIQMEELLRLRNKLKSLADEGLINEEPNDEEIMFPENWQFSAGVILFSIFDTGDAISENRGGYAAEGSLSGYRVSAGKGRDRIGLTIYDGEYVFDAGSSPVAQVKSESKTTSGRTDIDLAWLRILKQDEIDVIGVILGYKHLHSDKTVFISETYFDYYDEKTFRGENTWMMLNIGVFGSARLLAEYPVGFFFSANASLGMVEGMVRDQIDNVVGGSVRETYKDTSAVAWGFNATVGLQYPATRNLSVKCGYRGQIMNSIDGASPFGNSGEFYDGHQSVFGAVDVLF